MRKILLLAVFISLLVPNIRPVSGAGYSGKILLQVESYGRAWYVNPADGKRYYLKDGTAAYEIMRSLSLGISNKDLALIPTKSGERRSQKLVNRLKGRILLQVESRGEAWYVHPVTGVRYYLRDGVAAYDLMRTFALGTSNNDLRAVPMNDTQIVHDTTFDNVAYVTMTASAYSNAHYADQILPLASLTKLMTALVLLDQGVNLEASTTISSDHLHYPRQLVGDDVTSEVDLKVGDRMQMKDLWVALLRASSNQAAAALVDGAGFTRSAFVKLMNEKAGELGLTKTVFFDIAGLDAHNVTTPKEMALIAAAAFSNPLITSASGPEDYIIQAAAADGSVRSIPVTDRNYTLKTFTPDAAKTGFLVEAQRTVALKKGNTVVVVMHARSMKERNDSIAKLLAP